MNKKGNVIMTSKAYQKLFEQSQKIRNLEGIAYLLDWDHETFMPEGAACARGNQLKTLAGVIHKEKISRKLSKPLQELVDLKTGNILAHDLTDPQKSAVREWRRDYMIDTALPGKFVENFVKLTSEATLAWRKARRENRFSDFAPWLKKIVAANQKKAEYLKAQDHPYDALLDLYEPGMTTKAVTEVFDDLKKGNIALLNEIKNRTQIDDKILYGTYPEEKQLEVCRELLPAMGFDLKRGRLDLSTHPFSSNSHPSDSRITTRIQKDLVFGCILTVLHEGGHALYEMGLSEEEFGSPLGQHISMGIHESQSRFWETRIGLSKPFWEFFLPKLKNHFPALNHLDVETCYRAMNKVEPSFIRVEADEVTYPLHVILRFEIEKGLIEGSLKVKDLPEIWNAKIQEYLGITPPSDQLGCLQDIHWSGGAFGYFPTYAIGNLYAAQFFSHFVKKHPDWEKRVASGDLLFIRDFMHENVYRYGKEFRSFDLIKKVTGKPFSAQDYIDILSKKYREIYK